jgi:hypothetical protein
MSGMIRGVPSRLLTVLVTVTTVATGFSESPRPAQIVFLLAACVLQAVSLEKIPYSNAAALNLFTQVSGLSRSHES